MEVLVQYPGRSTLGFSARFPGGERGCLEFHASRWGSCSGISESVGPASTLGEGAVHMWEKPGSSKTSPEFCDAEPEVPGGAADLLEGIY